MRRRLLAALGIAAAEVQHALIMLGYRIRPYDLHLDARRWSWQRSGRQRSHDALDALTPAQLDELRRTAEHLLRRPSPEPEADRRPAEPTRRRRTRSAAHPR